jgi:catechol 2,3-dioxygenase-like lactoylglutathione lyase family enzyme
MIHGAHVIVYSKDSDADRDFFRDVLEYPFVDVGHGWLIFALPPAELAVHPSDENDKHELYFMCDDVQAFIAQMKARGVACSEVHEERWGSITHLTLPGGGKIGVYQPKHPSPKPKAPPRPKPKSKAKAKKTPKRGPKVATKAKKRRG